MHYLVQHFVDLGLYEERINASSIVPRGFSIRLIHVLRVRMRSGGPHSRTAQHGSLVSHTDQIIRKLLHHIRRRPRLHMFWVMCDEQCLLCFDNYDAFLALLQQVALVSNHEGQSVTRDRRRRCRLVARGDEGCYFSIPSSHTNSCHPP